MKDTSEMERDELFLYVEDYLKQKDVYSASETWRQTAARVEADDPQLAAWLRKAEERWDELNY